MDDIIRQIYGGFDRFPADLVGVDSGQYQKVRETAHSNYKSFRLKLPSELVGEFDRLMEDHLEMLSCGMEEGFVNGFKLGARLMVEILIGKE